MTELASEIRVQGVGPINAKIMFVGESPGEQEVLNHEPFVGLAGGVLNGLLAEVGIARQEVRLENVVEFRPKGNKFKEFYETVVEGGKKQIRPSQLLKEEIARLHKRIAEARPNIIVCLGEEPLKAVSGRTFKGGITNWRGSVISGVGGCKIIGTFHPSYLLRAWSDRPLTALDLRCAKEESWFPEIRRKKRIIEINLPYEVLLNRLADIRDNSTFVAFDIETNVEARFITSIAFADAPDYAVVVPIVFKGRRYWTDREEETLKGYVKEILEKEEIQKIAQNGQYDMLWLHDKWGINVNPLFMDTMVAHSLSLPECKKGLDFQCSIYTDIPYYKYELKTDDADTYFRYNATDALATFDSAMVIQENLAEDDQWDFYQNLPHRLLAPLREMSLRGIRIDLKLRKEMTVSNHKGQDRLVEIIREEPTCREFDRKVIKKNAQLKIVARWYESKAKCDAKGKSTKASICVKFPNPDEYIKARVSELPEFNPNSSDQLIKYFYEFREWKTILKTRKDGKRTPTADEEAIKKLLSLYQEPVLQTMLDLHSLIKESEFLEAKLEPDDRLHCSYDVTGTETGRISSKKYIYDTGANLQNQPAGKRKPSELRRIFIADPGKVFVQRDLKQAEAWIVAFLSEDPFLMEAIQSRDIHRYVAGLIFRKPPEEVTKVEREKAKRCVHALNYGMGYMKFAETAGISIVEARDLKNRYFAAFPKLTMWHSDIKMHLAKDRVLVTPMGRKREFAAGWNEDLWKEAWAHLPQSTVGDLLNVGFLEFSDWLKRPFQGVDVGIGMIGPVTGRVMPLHAKPGAKMNEQVYDCQPMLQIHDALVVQCPEASVPAIAARMKSDLEREIEVNGHKITIPSDCSVGPNWLDLKEVKK